MQEVYLYGETIYCCITDPHSCIKCWSTALTPGLYHFPWVGSGTNAVVLSRRHRSSQFQNSIIRRPSHPYDFNQ
jgi:hypothetical protein